MKRTEAMTSTAKLAGRFSVGEYAWSLSLMLVVAVFAFLFAPDPAASPMGTCARCSVWQAFGAAMGSVLDEPSRRLLSRGCGSVFAGITAAVCFVAVRYFLFLVLRKLRLLEYYRISGRLMAWSLLVTLSIALSPHFIALFVPITAAAVNVVLCCMAIALTILFIRVNHPLVLIAAYVLAGVLSALSVSGVVVLAAETMVLLVSKNRGAGERLSKLMSGYGYGQEYAYRGYGAYGEGGAYGSYALDDSQDTAAGGILEAHALVAERLRLLLFLFYGMGLVTALAALLVIGRSLDMDVRHVFSDWLGCYVEEAKRAMMVGKLFLVACCEAIAVVFVFCRFDRLLDVEHYLTTSDVIRIVLAILIATGVLLGIGCGFSPFADVCLYEIQVVPFAAQALAGFVILMAVVVFLVNMKCRKFVCVAGDDEVRAMVRRYSWMGIPIVLFFDALPVVLLAIATFHVWRG